MVAQFDDGRVAASEAQMIPRARALVPAPDGRGTACVCEALAARLNAAARRANLPAPIVLPTGSVSLFSVLLPLKSHRQRRKAMGFALEGQLCEDAEGAQLTLGPAIERDHYIVARCRDRALMKALPDADLPGPALPDVLGIPRPRTEGQAWNLWCTATEIYARATDGTGFVCNASEFAMFWKAGGQPELFSLTGPLSSGPEVTDLSGNPPPVDPDDLQLDLRYGAFKHRKTAPRRFVASAGIALAVCAIGQLALLMVDARALKAIAEQRSATVIADLAERAPGMSIRQPLVQIAAQLSDQNAPKQQDHFMTLLAEVSRALENKDDEVTFRELRYGAQDGVLTVLLQGRAFGLLQTAQAELIAAGLDVTSGTASATESGAEVLLQVRSRS